MKNRGNNIKQLTDYLRSLQYERGGLNYKVSMVVSVDNCVSVLERPDVQPRRVLVAHPVYSDSGNTDTYLGSFSTVIFVLEKSQEQQRTDDSEASQFVGILNTVDELCSRIENDISNGVLCGFDLVSIQISPEYSVFGGWLGYSIEVSLRK